MMDTPTAALEPAWYRQFWPWFLIALPTVAVIACFYSLNIAIRYSDSSVRDNYAKEGLAIQRSSAADNDALQQQLSADITIAADGIIEVAMRGRFAQQPAQLSIEFIHPLDHHHDVAVELHASGAGRYRGRLPALHAGRWLLELRQPEQRWQLRGNIEWPLQPLQHIHL